MNWIIDLECLKSLFNNKTKLIIFSNPNYLLGKVYTKNELEFITNLCKKWNVLCVVDECLDSTVVHNKHIRMGMEKNFFLLDFFNLNRKTYFQQRFLRHGTEH